MRACPTRSGFRNSAYFTVQGIYAGWWILGLLWPAAVIINLVEAAMVRSQIQPLLFALLATGCFIAMFIIFLFWTQPANQAT